GCTSCASFAPVVKEVADSDQIPVYAVNYEEIRDTDSELAELVKYTPAFLLFEKGKVVGNLDAGRSGDTESFKNAKSLSEWIGNYIDFKTVEGTAEGTIEECGQSCTAFGNLN
ncbi:MAG: thioredoxin family protein, partial [Solobacterium sp.]|nr:thioredoxin family protein [Solobacterium sp.]